MPNRGKKLIVPVNDPVETEMFAPMRTSSGTPSSFGSYKDVSKSAKVVRVHSNINKVGENCPSRASMVSSLCSHALSRLRRGSFSKSNENVLAQTRTIPNKNQAESTIPKTRKIFETGHRKARTVSLIKTESEMTVKSFISSLLNDPVESALKLLNIAFYLITLLYLFIGTALFAIFNVINIRIINTSLGTRIRLSLLHIAKTVQRLLNYLRTIFSKWKGPFLKRNTSVLEYVENIRRRVGPSRLPNTPFIENGNRDAQVSSFTGNQKAFLFGEHQPVKTVNSMDEFGPDNEAKPSKWFADPLDLRVTLPDRVVCTRRRRPWDPLEKTKMHSIERLSSSHDSDAIKEDISEIEPSATFKNCVSADDVDEITPCIPKAKYSTDLGLHTTSANFPCEISREAPSTSIPSCPANDGYLADMTKRTASVFQLGFSRTKNLAKVILKTQNQQEYGNACRFSSSLSPIASVKIIRKAFIKGGLKNVTVRGFFTLRLRGSKSMNGRSSLVVKTIIEPTGKSTCDIITYATESRMLKRRSPSCNTDSDLERLEAFHSIVLLIRSLFECYGAVVAEEKVHNP